jgi:hypothetical protein
MIFILLNDTIIILLTLSNINILEYTGYDFIDTIINISVFLRNRN